VQELLIASHNQSRVGDRPSKFTFDSNSSPVSRKQQNRGKSEDPQKGMITFVENLVEQEPEIKVSDAELEEMRKSNYFLVNNGNVVKGGPIMKNIEPKEEQKTEYKKKSVADTSSMPVAKKVVSPKKK